MDFNHFFTNDEIQTCLQAWAAQYPQLLGVRQIGESYEKRPIWLATVTNQDSGADLDKPAVWIDANIHATEITGTTVAMHLSHTLLVGYGKDDQITRILDQAVYYITPRINPDGAALAMSDKPRYLRSGVRPYPWPEKAEGLHEQDIDNDGRILQMRIQDPNGDWKISSLHPQLLEKRAPADHGGVYYRLLNEGMIEDYDGYLIKIAPAFQGLDFNRNFPFEWRTEGEQLGSGPYPASEPEIRALVQFIAAHPNINLAITYHTFSRVILRSYSTKADDQMETDDLWVIKRIGQVGTQLTGYPCVSVYHDFRYHPKEVTTGAFDDWMYDHRGIFAYTIELWDLPNAAGVENRKFMEWFREHPHEEDLTILEWARENIGPQCYVDWYEFDHPQLGKVELGGWDYMHTWGNPPSSMVEAEAQRNTPFAIALGDMLPHLSVHELKVTPLGNGDFHINLVVENSGFLPTYTSKQGLNRQATRPLRVELELPEAAVLVDGKRRTELGHLEGRSNKLASAMLWSTSPTDNRTRAQWVVHAPAGSQATLHIVSERAGAIHRTLTLA